MTQISLQEGDPPTLMLSGVGPRPASVLLAGPRARVRARLTGRGKTWTARLALHASRWSGPELALPSGTYRLEVTGLEESELAGLDLGMRVLPTLRVSVAGATVRIGAPLEPVYDAGDGQSALEARYAAGRGTPLENAVFFESFYGRTVGCNPLAIDRELQRSAPAVTRYWSVVDRSIPVPDGAIAVVEGSPEWWRARGVARLLVVNDWLRRRFVRRRGQRVIQTWHGTPLKRLALHRPGIDPRRWLAVLRESRRWDVLLAQNEYAARILRRAYGFPRRPVWVEGYPRNDRLAEGAQAHRAAARARLGIGEDERVILYAPTWRDDRERIVDFVDPVALAERTASVVLVRGHSRTLHAGDDVTGPRVIDVTGFPDTAELLAAADALVTDYSSVMFDFSVTGRPMYFMVPDLEHYRGELRGFYFDLLQDAPGPVVRTQDQLADEIVRGAHDEYAASYARWRERFNARDDGRAAERVVARLLDQRFVDR